MQWNGEASDPGNGHTGRPELEMEFALQDLPAVRRLVGSFALDAGLDVPRTEDFVLAVNEITTNAVIHGRPPATVRAWETGGGVVVEVTDTGEGIRDTHAGQYLPPAESRGGRGLWVARRLCDELEMSSDGAGCTVTLRAATTNGARSLTAA
jgi:anti-sigma regulatory factor (Ser/Thr protein kinase)